MELTERRGQPRRGVHGRQASRRQGRQPRRIRVRSGPVPNHLTPEEIAAEHGIEREDVLRFCVERDVPIFHGQIDKTLFAAEWTAAQAKTEPDQ